MTKTCNECGSPGPFYRNRGRCNSCHGARVAIYRARRIATPGGREIHNAKARARQKKYRQNPKYRAKLILKDSKRSDLKAKRRHELTLEFVNALIAKPCTYCGETVLKMTLDRKDNSIGYIPDNVVPCCIRCNYLRRDMPFPAWMALAPAIRAIRKAGLFGEWIGGTSKRKLEGKSNGETCPY